MQYALCDRVTSLDETNEYENDGSYEKDVNEATDRIGSNKADRPKHQQDDCNRR